MIKELKLIQSFFAGTLMGIAAIIPGVSSGTIALITGVYQKMIDAFNVLFSKQKGKSGALVFILIIISGMLISTFLFASVMETLIDTFPNRMGLFFAGLIIGTIPSIFRRIKAHNSQTVNTKHIMGIVLAFILVVLIGQFSSNTQTVMVEITLTTGVLIMLAGILSTGTAIIPGISGSMLLVTLGMYGTMISAMANFLWPLLILLGVGSLLGFVLFSKMMNVLLNNHAALTYSVITGFLLGSVVHIFPDSLTVNTSVILSYIVIFLGGFSVVLWMGRVKRYA